MLTVEKVRGALAAITRSTRGEIATGSLGSVSIDSRHIEKGSVFVAIKGERHDGHLFLEKARMAGAALAIVERPVDDKIPQIVVDNCITAFGLLAKCWRAQFALQLISVAGSNGKTSTTQMIAAILREHFGESRFCATQGNFNNEIGVPLTLFRLSFEHRAAVIEAGMNHPGEMGVLMDWIRPTVALITNAQREHQEFMQSVVATAYENGLSIVSLDGAGKAVFPNDDDCAPIWRAMALARGVDVLTWSTNPVIPADIQGIFEHGVLTIYSKRERFDIALRTSAPHMIHNAVGAVAAALAAGIAIPAIVEGLSKFEPLKGRGAHCFLSDWQLTLVDDAYNANPDSVRAAVDSLAMMPAPRTLILGDMGEIGQSSRACHREIGLYAREKGIDRLFACGDESLAAVLAFGVGAEHFTSREALIEATLKIAPQGGSMTVKASHSMGFAAVVDALTHRD